MGAIKATLRIPTEEQYAYIELQMDVDSEDAAVEAYKRVTGLVKGGQGLDIKEWQSVLDEFLSTDTVIDGISYWERMNNTQRNILQEIKKSMKRIEYGKSSK